MAFGVAGTIPTVDTAHAAAVDPATQVLADGIETVSLALGAASALDELAQAVPFTGVAPGLSEGVNVLQSLHDTLAALNDAGSTFVEQAPGAVADELEGLDTTVAGVTVTFGCDGACDVGETAVSADTVGDTTTITLPIRLSRVVSTPLSFSSDVVNLDGGNLSVTLAATTTLHLTFDAAQALVQPDRALSVAPFAVAFSASLTGGPITADTRFGIADATASLTGLGVTMGLTEQFADPDGVGGITVEELKNTTIADLAAVSRTGSVTGSVSFDTDLVPGSPDVAPMSIGDADLSDGYSFTLAPLTALAPFTLTTPEALIAGLGQSAAALGGAQAATDPVLPFLKGTIRRLTAASRPVLDVVDSLGVICGTVDGATPSGSVENLASGTPVYCQAIVTTGVASGSVVWTADSPATAGANTSGVNADQTIGLTPSKNATFTTTAAGDFEAHVTYTATFDDDNDGTVDRTVPGKHSQRPPRSVQDLAAMVATLGGFDDPTNLLKYDPGTKALTFHLSKTFDGPSVDLPLDVGDQLESATGIVGLTSAGAGISASAKSIHIDLTPGVLLLPQSEWASVTGPGGCPDPAISQADIDLGKCVSPIDLFFVKVNPAAPEFSVGDAAFTFTSPKLVGQLGYLGIEAGVDSFGLQRADNTKPVLTVDLTKAGDMKVGTTVLTDAIRLRELLFKISDRVTVSPLNLQLSGALTVTAKLNGSTIATAGVGVQWNLLSAGSPTITPALDFHDLFKNFNPVPNLFGTHSGADSTTVLSNPTATFTDSAQGVQVDNLTDGSSCTVDSFTATTLTCAQPLAGGTDNTWQSGDAYRVHVGSALAMLQVLLDNIDQITKVIQNLTGIDAATALDTKLPVVGISPRDLLKQIDELRQALAEIKGTGATVRCGLAHTGGEVTGDPSQVVLDSGGSGTVYCVGATIKPALADPAPTWTIGPVLAQAGVTATVTVPADPSTTVGPSPTDVVTVTFTGPAGTTVLQRQNVPQPDGSLVETGYQVKVGWTDVDGAHDEEYPTLSQPGTLQALEKAIKEKLGVTQGFSLALVDGPDPGQKLVTIDLDIGRCNDASLCDPAKVNMGALSSPINASVSGLGGLVAAGSGGEVAVKYSASARIKLGLDLSGVPKVYVMPSTGISLKGRFEATNLDFDATLGPFSIKAGTHARLNDQGDSDPTNDVFDGNGTVKLGADLTIGSIAAPVLLSTFIGSLGTYLAPTFTAAPNSTCGTITTDPSTTPATTHDLAGLGCGLISVGVSSGSVTNYVADLGLEVTLSGGSFTVTPYIPTDLAAKFAAAALDLRLLLQALPAVIGELRDGLRATASAAAGNGKLPLIGDALDAGADVAGKLQELTQTLVDKIDPVVAAISDPTNIPDALQTLVYDNLQPTGFLLKPDGTAITAKTDIEVYLDCGGGYGAGCAGKNLTDLKDVRVIFAVGQVVDTDVPFDLGLDGVPLRLTGSVHPHVSWSFVVDLGLNRATGPYIGVEGPAGSSRPKPELNLEAGIKIGEDEPACSAVLNDPLSPLSNDAGSIVSGTWDDKRCLGGQLAFLGVQVRDGDGATPNDKASGADVKVGLDLTNGAETTLGLTNIGDVKLQPVVGIDTTLNLRFRTGIVGGQDAGFPEVVGTFHLGWSWTKGSAVTAPDVKFDNLYLNLEPLLKKFIEPISNEVRKITGPFKPVIDTLTAPIPVVSDLAALVGQPPVTLLGLMQLISGNDLSLIQSLAAFISFINDPKVAQGYIPLGGATAGSFGVNGAGARLAQSPTDAGKLVEGATAAANSLLSYSPKNADGTPNTASNLGDKALNTTMAATKAKLPGTFGVPGLTFPFLDNPSQIFGLLMGQDITLVRYDIGPLQATAGFSYNFPPILVGPVPIAIGVGGSVTVKGRFVIGYDTSGLRKVLAGGSGMYLFDGIFLDDLDINGVDVPEISFIGEVYAQAGVSIGIASAGIVAGLRITVDLNLDDSPNPDGKLHIEEIFNKLSNPICLFDVSGKLEAFIKAYVELNLFITTLRFDFTLLELELLNFSGKCTPPQPKLAHFSGSVLVLNVGAFASQRNVDVDNKDEEMTVRPAGGGRYSVTGFGLHQTFGPGGQFDGPAITEVHADGTDGNDKFQMLPGSDEEHPQAAGGVDTSLPFLAKAVLNGGADNDVLVGGDAGDTLDGGPGDDRIQGGKGDDTIYGRAGIDTLNGEEGNDTLDGGDDGDQIQGGPGDDRGIGGGGADLLQGGPGTATDPAVDPNATDGNDTLIGGADIDTIEGGSGNDTLYGDAEVYPSTAALCDADQTDATSGADKVSGGIGDDVVVGGDGPDELFGGGGNDTVCGNAGDDKMDGDQAGDPKAGVPGDDIVRGGSGSDDIVGGDGNDLTVGGPNTDVVDGGNGNDDVVGGAGRDLLHGGAGRDIVVGDTASIDQSVPKAGRGAPSGSVTLVSGVGASSDAVGAKCAVANDRNNPADADSTDSGFSDCVYGDDGDDLIYGEGGNDQVFAGNGDDLVYAGVGDDNPVRGEAGNDTMYGEAGQDNMYGDSGADTMYGNADNDTMRGGIDDDHMEGNEAVDTMYGEGGQDDIIGGSSADGVADGGDIIDGGAASDVIVGDNGTISRPGGNDPDDALTVRRDVALFDVNDPTVGGDDTIHGGLAADQIWGGNAGDHLFGDSGVDRIEGNDGGDTISGGNDADRIAGGSSSRATLFGPDGITAVPYDQAPDTGDTIHGDDDDDVIAGDNATVAINGVTTMTTFDTTASHGDDTIHGDAGQDRIYGQLGDDTITGDADEDYVIGDLGGITPGTPLGVWPGGAPQYTVLLELAPDVGGIDTIDGGTGDDHLYGGAADDVMRGGSGDDMMEGNGGRDTMYGWAPGQDTLPDGITDQDDMIGGSSAHTRPGVIARADVGELVMEGNADHDVMTGDNADIDPIVADGGGWAPDEVIAGARKRTVTLLDRERIGFDLAGVSGDDVMLGNTGSDRMFGEGGNDSVKGNEADDLIEGNQGDDWLEGNAGEDDLIGGSSFLAADGGAPQIGGGDDLGDPDGTDAIFGGDGADVLAGDNAVVVRKTDGTTASNTAAYTAGLATAYFTTDPADNVPGWWLGVATHRQVRLLDRTTLNGGRFGDDLISGGAGADVAFGQDGNDWVSGGTDDDTIEGNGGNDSLFGDRAPALDGSGGEPVLAVPPAPGSAVADRDGAVTPDGEDDIVGGSNVSHRDGADTVGGDGEDDFVLGDNGTLQRNIVGSAYVKYAGDGARDRIMRRAIRLDVGAAAGAGVWGGDTIRGNDGDDAVWGQDGGDTIYGQAGDDDLLGELGDDAIYGGLGEDAIVGDRGGIRNTELGSSGAQFSAPVYTFDSHGPPFLTYTGLRPGTYDRRVDLTQELPGSVGGPFSGPAAVLASNGVTTGGNDMVRGGPDHDSIHGAAGDDLLNGDSGGDIIFGADGSDVMWGGRGSDDPTTPDDRGANDSLVDYLFGGRGGDPTNTVGVITGGADIIDYLPRPGVDPQAWFDAIAPYDDGAAGGESLRQHHQGVDWVYGGWDRDVMEANLADNGPNPGDRLLDWTGAYNLYVHCPAAYGGYNDVRVQSPALILFEESLAFSLGAGASLTDVQTKGSSAYNELAMVYKPDVKDNSGKAYPTTPGHFENPTACVND